MSDQLPAIIVLTPLFGAILVGLLGSRDHRVCFPITLASLLVSFAAVIAAAARVFREGPIDYFMGGWEEPLAIGIQLRMDALNAPVAAAVAMVVILAAVSAIRRVGLRFTEKTPQFHTLYLLLCTGLFGITITGDAFNLFVLVEVTSLASYGLIAMGSSRKGTLAAFHYLLMGTVGASFYLLGVGYLYLKTGTLNMQDIHHILVHNAEVAESRSVTIAFVLILLGVWIKMAFFPLYGWLPNAYSSAPSAAASVLAPLMTKISVYVMIRVMLSVFGLDWIAAQGDWSRVVVWLAVAAILAGSVLALGQREIKRMLCYLIVAEVGYMVGGAWLADEGLWGMTGAVYHILADALMTLCLFLAAAYFSKRFGAVEISDLEGMFRRAPWASAGFAAGGLAMIGIPPTCGFFSKFYLIRGGIESGRWEFVVALLVSSLVNAVLFFRIFEIAHFGNRPAEGHGEEHGGGEEGDHGEGSADPADPGPEDASFLPKATLAPLLVTAALIVLLGLANGPVVEFVRTALGAS